MGAAGGAGQTWVSLSPRFLARGFGFLGLLPDSIHKDTGQSPAGVKPSHHCLSDLVPLPYFPSYFGVLLPAQLGLTEADVIMEFCLEN